MGKIYLTVESSINSLIRVFRLSEQNILLVVQRGSDNWLKNPFFSPIHVVEIVHFMFYSVHF